jgi:hypothetical protein
MGGYPLAHAMMLMIPEAWYRSADGRGPARVLRISRRLDGTVGRPPAMAFTDGRQIGATLDRNGLRPARFIVTDDDLVVMASEVGVLDIPERKIVKKWRLQPGKMLLVDTEQGCIIDDDELKRTLATRKPYRSWIERSRIALDELPDPAPPQPTAVPLLDRQQAFGYTQEDLKVILAPMAATGEEAVGSMGNDAALPVRYARPKGLYSYFKQRFAQGPNPPIDPIREELVMSLSFIGPRPNLLRIDEINPPRGSNAGHLTMTRWKRSAHRALRRRIPGGSSTSAIPHRCKRDRQRSRRSVRKPGRDHLGYNILIIRPQGVGCVAADSSIAGDHSRPSTSRAQGIAHGTSSSSKPDRRASCPVRAARGMRRRGDPPLPRSLLSPTLYPACLRRNQRIDSSRRSARDSTR